jgi:hypothetical protein
MKKNKIIRQMKQSQLPTLYSDQNIIPARAGWMDGWMDAWMEWRDV